MAVPSRVIDAPLTIVEELESMAIRFELVAIAGNPVGEETPRTLNGV
jgi:hypothetical protein